MNATVLSPSPNRIREIATWVGHHHPEILGLTAAGLTIAFLPVGWWLRLFAAIFIGGYVFAWGLNPGYPYIRRFLKGGDPR